MKVSPRFINLTNGEETKAFKIKNASENVVLFKIRRSEPKLVHFSPTQGFVEPGLTQHVQVKLSSPNTTFARVLVKLVEIKREELENDFKENWAAASKRGVLKKLIDIRNLEFLQDTGKASDDDDSILSENEDAMLIMKEQLTSAPLPFDPHGTTEQPPHLQSASTSAAEKIPEGGNQRSEPPFEEDDHQAKVNAAHESIGREEFKLQKILEQNNLTNLSEAEVAVPQPANDSILSSVRRSMDSLPLQQSSTLKMISSSVGKEPRRLNSASPSKQSQSTPSSHRPGKSTLFSTGARRNTVDVALLASSSNIREVLPKSRKVDGDPGNDSACCVEVYGPKVRGDVAARELMEQRIQDAFGMKSRVCAVEIRDCTTVESIEETVGSLFQHSPSEDHSGNQPGENWDDLAETKDDAVMALRSLLLEDNLRHVTLTATGIVSFDCSLNRFTRLSTLDLSGNFIHIIQPGIDLPNLRSLNLSGNRLKSLDFLQSLTGLTTLIVSGNALAKLETSVGMLVPLSAHLSTLDMSMNEVCRLRNYADDVLNALPNLKYFDSRNLTAVLQVGYAPEGARVSANAGRDQTFDSRESSSPPPLPEEMRPSLPPESYSYGKASEGRKVASSNDKFDARLRQAMTHRSRKQEQMHPTSEKNSQGKLLSGIPSVYWSQTLRFGESDARSKLTKQNVQKHQTQNQRRSLESLQERAGSKRPIETAKKSPDFNSAVKMFLEDDSSSVEIRQVSSPMGQTAEAKVQQRDRQGEEREESKRRSPVKTLSLPPRSDVSPESRLRPSSRDSGRSSFSSASSTLLDLTSSGKARRKSFGMATPIESQNVVTAHNHGGYSGAKVAVRRSERKASTRHHTDRSFEALCEMQEDPRYSIWNPRYRIPSQVFGFSKPFAHRPLPEDLSQRVPVTQFEETVRKMRDNFEKLRTRGSFDLAEKGLKSDWYPMDYDDVESIRRRGGFSDSIGRSKAFGLSAPGAGFAKEVWKHTPSHAIPDAPPAAELQHTPGRRRSLSAHNGRQYQHEEEDIASKPAGNKAHAHSGRKTQPPDRFSGPKKWHPDLWNDETGKDAYAEPLSKLDFVFYSSKLPGKVTPAKMAKLFNDMTDKTGKSNNKSPSLELSQAYGNLNYLTEKSILAESMDASKQEPNSVTRKSPSPSHLSKIWDTANSLDKQVSSRDTMPVRSFTETPPRAGRSTSGVVPTSTPSFLSSMAESELRVSSEEARLQEYMKWLEKQQTFSAERSIVETEERESGEVAGFSEIPEGHQGNSEQNLDSLSYSQNHDSDSFSLSDDEPQRSVNNFVPSAAVAATEDKKSELETEKPKSPAIYLPHAHVSGAEPTIPAPQHPRDHALRAEVRGLAPGHPSVGGTNPLSKLSKLGKTNSANLIFG